MYNYSWVASVAELSAASVCQSQTIPVLRPPEISRFQRWQRILSWYGLREGSRVDTASPDDDLRHLEGHLIAALDDEAALIADFLAACDKRPFVRCKDVSELSDQAADPKVRSVLIVARPEYLSNRAILQLSARLSIPWGLLTGRDAPALVFAAAKLLIARQRLKLPCAHLDAIARRHWSWNPEGGPSEELELDRVSTWETLSRSEWDTVSIHCHGDGAHANFNSVVLCGVPDQDENVLGGRRAPGCAFHADSPRCKRVHDAEKRALRFGDVRTRRMCLFTCNGFSVAGDVYPSEASFILSVTEGYPAAVLTTDRRLRFDPWLFPAVHRLLEREGCIAHLSRLLNDISAFRESARPYLLYGDPAGISLDSPQGGTSTRIELNRFSVAVADLGDMAACKIIGIAEHSGELTLERGETIALLIGRGGTQDQVPLVDRSRDFERLEDWIGLLAIRVRRAQRLEMAIRRRHSEIPRADPTITDALADLAAISSQIERSVLEGEQLIGELLRKGIWLSHVDTWRSHLLLLMAIWDTQFAALLDEHLLERELSELLQEGFYLIARSNGPLCPRCGCVLIRGRACAPLLAGAEHEWIDCPTCGPREAADAGMPRLYAEAPAALFPGQQAHMIVRWSQAHDPPFDQCGSGLLITHLKDSGHGRVAYRSVDRVVQDQHVTNIPVPAESALEIHTLRFALVRDMNVSYLRLRAPCVKPME
jgi:hypothetical protein